MVRIGEVEIVVGENHLGDRVDYCLAELPFAEAAIDLRDMVGGECRAKTKVAQQWLRA
jgi:hypothetical protein